jgi:hypothetical protein
MGVFFFAAFPLASAVIILRTLVASAGTAAASSSSRHTRRLKHLGLRVVVFHNILRLWHVSLRCRSTARECITLPAIDASVPCCAQASCTGSGRIADGASRKGAIVLHPLLAGVLVGTVGLGAVFVVDFRQL